MNRIEELNAECEVLELELALKMLKVKDIIERNKRLIISSTMKSSLFQHFYITERRHCSAFCYHLYRIFLNPSQRRCQKMMPRYFFQNPIEEVKMKKKNGEKCEKNLM